MVDQVYRHGILRDVYPRSFLSEPQLARMVDGVSRVDRPQGRLQGMWNRPKGAFGCGPLLMPLGPAWAPRSAMLA